MNSVRGMVWRLGGAAVLLVLALLLLRYGIFGLMAALFCLGGVVAITATGPRLWGRGLPGSREVHDLEISQEVDPYFARDHARQGQYPRERQKW